MRIVIISCGLLLTMLYLVGCNNRDKTASSGEGKQETVLADTSSSPIISFREKSHDFGTIHRNKKDSVSVDFVFTNTGKSPLVIHKVDVSCGCLSVVYPKHPIKKDSTGVIHVTVNPKLVDGVFKKSIFVNSNALTDVALLKVGGHSR